jgi:hypothetical protein
MSLTHSFHSFLYRFYKEMSEMNGSMTYIEPIYVIDPFIVNDFYRTYIEMSEMNGSTTFIEPI